MEPEEISQPDTVTPSHGHGHAHAADDTAAADRHAHFDEAAATWDDDPAKLERARLTADLLRDSLPLTGTERVLDVGGGTGQLTLNLASSIGSAVISDPAAGMATAAAANIERAGLGDRVEALQLDLTTDQAPGTFDGVWSQLAMHHVPDPDLLLRRIRESLNPDGWVAIVDLDADSSGDFHAHNPDFDGHHGFDRETFAERMRAAGFADVSVQDGGSVEKELDGEGRTTFTMFLAIGRA